MSFEENELIIEAKNISKRYELYRRPVHRLLQTCFMGKKQFYREFWALRDINFKVHRGESIGVIGRNGAGKSTLLQILVGTLPATTGEVFLKGKVAALLELGSGFNPTFTGRKNVYMNGMLLGFSKKEIDARFDEIEEFADIGDFLDEPVEKYSSGMRVRLAFAVQIMSEPDILIVDEALAVGDVAFQRKCYAKMEERLKRGMTLFLVTHSTGKVKNYCHRVLYLKSGRCVFDGDPIKGEQLYMQDLLDDEKRKNQVLPSAMKKPVPLKKTAPEKEAPEKKEPASKEFVYEREMEAKSNSYGVGSGRISRVRVYGLEKPNILPLKGKIRIEADCEWSQDEVRQLVEKKGLIPNMIVGYCFANKQNVPVFGVNTFTEGIEIDPFSRDRMTVCFEIQLPELAQAHYFLTVALQLGLQSAQISLEWNDLVMDFVTRNTHHFGGNFNPETKVFLK